MSDSSFREVVTDSGLVITRAFLDNLRAVGLESMATYYEVVYNLYTK
jgi:hypothetical protein